MFLTQATEFVIPVLEEKGWSYEEEPQFIVRIFHLKPLKFQFYGGTAGKS